MAEFEKTYRDRITGYEGVATARTEYAFSNNVSVRLTAIGKDGRPEEVWISDACLEEVRPKDNLGFHSDNDGPHAAD